MAAERATAKRQTAGNAPVAALAATPPKLAQSMRRPPPALQLLRSVLGCGRPELMAHVVLGAPVILQHAIGHARAGEPNARASDCANELWRSIMLQPCPATARLAAAVVHAQLAIDGSARSRGPAPNVVKRLHTRFSKLFGTAGFDALLARSLALAQWDRPCLDELRASPGETLERLDACTSDGALDHDAAIAIVSRFLELMIQLVGEDLTLRLLREAGSATMEVMLNDGTR